MAATFLDELPISAEERAKLAGFGANTPFALLSMRKASKDAFDDYIGRERADTISSEIENLLTDEQRASLSKPAEGRGHFGARLDRLPGSSR